jgi:hypothetical protein
VRQKASGNVIPTRKYREVLVTSRSLGVGDRGAAALRGAFNDPSTCCTDGSLRSIFASIEAQQGSHRVITPQRTSSSRRTALSDSVKPARQSNPTHGDGLHWLHSGSDWVHTSPISGQWRYQSLSWRELLYRLRPSRVSSVARSMPGLSPRKPRRWQITINVTTPVAASNSCNNGMELASKHNVQPQYHSPPFSWCIHNNGMELVLTTQRPTLQNHNNSNTTQQSTEK